MKIKDLVDKHINNLFYDIQVQYDIEDGDIGIERTFELDELEDKLINLIEKYLKERG